MGVKLVVYADLDLPFEDLNNQVKVICLPKNEQLEALTSAEITDVALSFDYQRDDKKSELRVGPMKKEQGVNFLKTVGNIKQFFEPSDEGRQILELVESVPETFLYFDVDTSIETERESDSWFAFATETIEYELGLFEGIKNLVLECD